MDDETRYAALAARDRRFDGVFFVAVETTGIYCRPICPARTPRRDRCRFYLRAAEAERDGYRACLRCRPERAPRDPLAAAPVDARARLVAHATAAIDAGALHEGSLEHLATRLGVSARHLRRVMEAELGVSPRAWAETRRLAIAKQLLQDTALPITEVALASGYRSLRRFHAAFSARFGRPPRALRGAEAPRATPVASEPTDGFTLRLEYRPPLDWVALLGFLGARAIPGVEAVDGARWTRVVRVGDARRTIEVEPAPGGAAALEARFSLSLAPRALPLVARLRALFDLDAHPEVIAAQLARDPRLAPLVAARPGLRVPGAFEPFEVAVRALLGQQVSVRAATTLATRLVARAGGWVPDAATLATWPLEDLRALGLPAQRARALHALALAVARGDVCLDRGVDPDATQRALLTLPGVGPWTASYVAMRALGWPDALPAGDLVLRQRLELPDARAVEARAEAWRPWRAYGVLHLWTAGPPRPGPEPITHPSPPRAPQRSVMNPSLDDAPPLPPSAPGRPPHHAPEAWVSTPAPVELILDAPVGPLRLRADGDRLVGVYFERHAGAPPPLGARPGPVPAVLEEAAAQLASYFAGRRDRFSIPTHADGSPLERAVWAALAALEPGETITYGALAARVGRPGAARAVGGANARNPLSIVVPCHRVIGADGRLTGYAGGLTAKRWLLAHEARWARGPAA